VISLRASEFPLTREDIYEMLKTWKNQGKARKKELLRARLEELGHGSSKIHRANETTDAIEMILDDIDSYG
jgi:hypothetical protein